MDMEEALRKFMKSFGLRMDIELNRKYRNPGGQPIVCMKTTIWRGEEEEYVSYFCYKLHRNLVVFEEGNEVKGVKDGILAYLGSPKEVENAIDNFTRARARPYLEKYI